MATLHSWNTFVFIFSSSLKKDGSTTHQQNYTKRQKMWLANHQWDRLIDSMLRNSIPTNEPFKTHLNQFSSLPSSFSMFNAATAYRDGSAQFQLLQCVDMNEANYYLYIYIYTFSLLMPFYLGLLEMAFFFRPLWIKRSQVSKKGTCWFQDVESCWDPPSPFRTCPLLLARSCVGTSDLSGLCQP